MAFYIEVEKEREDEVFAFYKYSYSIAENFVKRGKNSVRGQSRLVEGHLKIDKLNREYYVIEMAEGDTGGYVGRAVMAILREWRKGKLPEKTCWAS